eukprot:3367784-Lingulodinium_polyedra.AAC.1
MCIRDSPCTSWSVARNRTNTIRSRLEPWGVSSPRKPFSDLDCQRLEEGNRTLRATLRVVRALQQQSLPWVLENPASSTMWAVPELQTLAARPS